MNNKLFTILFLMGFILIPSVLADNSQGLVWGVEEGQEIQYTLHMRMNMETTYTTTTMDVTEGLVFTIITLPDIPTVVDERWELPYAYGEMTYTNGTDVGYLGMPISLSNLIMPIGNWALIDEIYKDSMETPPAEYTISWINDFSSWGLAQSVTDYPTEGSSTSASMIFSKSDGVLSSLSFSVIVEDVGSTEMTLSRVGGPLNITTIIIIGSSAVIIIVAVAILKDRY